MTHPCSFVDPSSLSLPSKRSVSPDDDSDHSSPLPADDPPRKRSRSAVTPEERKEARAHRNRIAAQNSRDRRKAQFTYLERRVAELEEENRRLRAGIHVAAPSTPSIPVPDTSALEHEQDQRDHENQELRERIRTLEKGYEAVVRALASQTPTTSTIPTPSAPSTAAPSQPASHDSTLTSPLAPSLPLSPSSSHSTLVDSPLLVTSGDSFDSPKSPVLSKTETPFALPRQLDLSLAISSPTCHLARVVNTVGRSAVSLQRVGGAKMATGPPEDEATSDVAITRLFAEILASPPLGPSTLPSFSTSSEDAFGKEEVLTKTETKTCEGLGLDDGVNGIDTVNWVEQVLAEMEMDTNFGSPAFISPFPPRLPSFQTAPLRFDEMFDAVRALVSA